MDDFMITTMPIKPYEKINIGLMIAPTLCDVLGTILNCKKILAFNLLHSYEDKNVNLQNYINNIEKFKIKYDDIIKDIEHVEEYLNKLEELYRKGTINIKKGEVLRCDCGKVEMTLKSIRYNKDGDLYYWKDNKIFCKHCNKECKKYIQNNLYLDIKGEYCSNISITPIFSINEIKDLTNKFINKNILISKNRQNNYSLKIEGQNFNVDIDMLWMMFNQIEESKNQILIASNHQLYEMFISNYINNIFGNKNLHFIATPYLTNNENIDLADKILSKDNPLYKKLSILYSLKWKYKTLNWNNGILELLNKLTSEELIELYNIILNLSYNEQANIDNIINNLLTDINLNKNIKTLKRSIYEN